jgi:hypothetical protein
MRSRCMRSAWRFGASAIAALLFGSLVSCEAADAPAGNGGGDVDSGFIVFAPAFQDYRSWYSTPGVATGAPDDGVVHVTAPLTTYINMKPSHGSTEFPLGTIIVKEDANPDLTQRKIFAMTKHGDNYNATGATNWEFFELQFNAQGTLTISWDGTGPPANNDTYGKNPNACNDCHMSAAANDFVWTTGLTLSSF